MPKTELREATGPRWEVETRHDVYVGVDTGWCLITSRGAIRVSGTHREVDHGTHASHLWKYDINPGGYVRVRRGYHDGNQKITTRDTIHYRAMVVPCGDLDVRVVPFNVVDEDDYNVLGCVMFLTGAVGRAEKLLDERFPKGWRVAETDHD